MSKRHKSPSSGAVVVMVMAFGLVIFVLASLVVTKLTPARPGQSSVQFLPLIVQPPTPTEVNSPDNAQEIQDVEPEIDSLVFTDPVPRRPVAMQRVEEREGKRCVPYYTFTGDHYLCYAGTKGHPELWLVSDSKGFETLLLEEPIIFRWADDGQHIVFSPEPVPSSDPFAPPLVEVRLVYWMDVVESERREIGQTTSTKLDTTPNGDIAFLYEDTLHVVNPRKGTEYILPSAFTIGHPSTPVPEPASPSTPEVIPEFLQGTLAPPSTLTPTADPVLTFSQHYPNLELRFALSPDGRKVILHQINHGRGSLVLVDLETQTARLLTTQADDEWSGFDWSPDGTQVVYASVHEERWTPELWLVPSEGDDPPRLLMAEERRGRYEWVTWHPNKQDLLYVYTPAGNDDRQSAEYRVMNVEKGDSFTLFTNGWGLTLFDGGRQFSIARDYLDGMPERRSWIVKLTEQ